MPGAETAVEVCETCEREEKCKSSEGHESAPDAGPAPRARVEGAARDVDDVVVALIKPGALADDPVRCATPDDDAADDEVPDCGWGESHHEPLAPPEVEPLLPRGRCAAEPNLGIAKSACAFACVVVA